MFDFFNNIPDFILFIIQISCIVIFNLFYFLSVLVYKCKSIVWVSFWTLILVIQCIWLFPYFKDHILLCLLIIIISYINACIILKNSINIIIYTFIFIILSLAFIYWITALFGQYYYKNIQNVILQYSSEIELIYEKDYCMIIFDFKLSLIYFKIGLEKYFVMPTEITFKNIHFIQYIFGLILGVTTLGVFADLIKGLLKPEDNKLSKCKNIEN